MSQKSQVSANWLNLVWNAIRVLVLLLVIRKSRTQGFVLMWNNSQELSRGLSSAMAVVFGNASNISFTVSPAKCSNSACGGYSSMTPMATDTFLHLGGYFFHRSACFSSLKRWNSGKLGTTAAAIFLASGEKFAPITWLFFFRGSHCRDQELRPLALIASSQLTSLHQIRCLYNVSMVKVLQVRKTDADISAKLILKKNFLKVVSTNVHWWLFTLNCI